jgi:hypothetical protein
MRCKSILTITSKQRKPPSPTKPDTFRLFHAYPITTPPAITNSPLSAQHHARRKIKYQIKKPVKPRHSWLSACSVASNVTKRYTQTQKRHSTAVKEFRKYVFVLPLNKI